MTQMFFTNPDSPEATSMLRTMLEKINLPILGLIVKVNQDDEVVNVELTDENTIKALALCAALENEEEE